MCVGVSYKDQETKKVGNYKKEIKGEIWQMCLDRWMKQIWETKRMEEKEKWICEEKINKKKMWKCSQASLEQVAAM